MGWYTVLAILLAQRYITSTTGALHTLTLPQTFNPQETNSDENISLLEEYEDAKLEKLGNILTKLLILPWPKGISPLLYVENEPPEDIENDQNTPIDQNLYENDEEMAPIPLKRSRYYRKYPWKRQNSRYDAENRYLCQPSKEDVFRLLVALHEARQGNRNHVVNFCNRKRPATAIFTNIRFLGKRK